MTDSVVAEGYARLRDGKKWKTRWLVLRKPSPVADCLVLLVFKDKSEKVQGSRERASVTLEEICGLEVGQWYEGVAFTLAILCLSQAALLGFDSREALLAWDARLRYSLGEVHRFAVTVLPGTKLEIGPASLHLCNNLLALARDVPPVIIGHWNLPDLRRYGPVPNGFVFEGGTRCGYWAGVFLLASGESEQISFLFDCIVRGLSPTRGPFGLRPLLPDPSGSQTNSEEKLNHEAQELEKRLSMLSHGSSTASSTYGPCSGGDDRSISGSSDTSDTSHSDCSVGSRLTIWTEPTSNPAEGATSSHAGSKLPLLHIVEKPSPNQTPGNRTVAKSSRQLQEIGRQSSADSGIATGSHSSYSGSFSSYTGSLDAASGEDFGSVFSLPPHLAQDLSPCSCPAAPAHDYQVPTSLRYLYDSPKSLLTPESKDGEQSTSTKDAPTTGDVKSIAKTNEDQPDSTDKQPIGKQLTSQSEESKKTKVAPSSEASQTCSSVTSTSKTIVTICSVCGGFKGTPLTPTTSTPAIPGRQILEKSWISRHSDSSEKSLPRKGREKFTSLLADLLGFPDRQAEAKVENQYESMKKVGEKELLIVAPAVPVKGLELKKRAVIYENCFKCQGEHCRPPPRSFPIKPFGNRKVPALKILPEKTSPEEEGNEEKIVDVWNEEMKNLMVADEDKKLSSREEKRRVDPAYEIMERNPEAEDKRYELMGSYSQQRLHNDSEGPVFVFPPEAPLADRPRSDGGAATYVNIPISPTSKKQLHYMELELQEPGGGARSVAPHLQPNRKSSTKYAQIDITATETAHKVGAQHALGRQEGLHTLELRRKTTPH